jgi:hypothetical protein
LHYIRGLQESFLIDIKKSPDLQTIKMHERGASISSLSKINLKLTCIGQETEQEAIKPESREGRS